jgi:hypothetical protein
VASTARQQPCSAADCSALARSIRLATIAVTACDDESLEESSEVVNILDAPSECHWFKPAWQFFGGRRAFPDQMQQAAFNRRL